MKNILKRIISWLRPVSCAEQYLNKATDIADLENRIKYLQHKGCYYV